MTDAGENDFIEDTHLILGAADELFLRLAKNLQPLVEELAVPELWSSRSAAGNWLAVSHWPWPSWDHCLLPLQCLACRGGQQLAQALAGFEAGAAEPKQVVQRVVASVRDFLGGEDHWKPCDDNAATVAPGCDRK